MDDKQFWTLIEQSRVPKTDDQEADCCAQANRLTNLLLLFSPEEIVDFDRHFARRRMQAYTWDLWGVAYMLNGGCSDDCFEYFRCWLIGQGQTVYEAALKQPESIGDIVDDSEDYCECEALMYAADHAYKRITGVEIVPTEIDYPEITGEPWTPPELDARFPILSARF